MRYINNSLSFRFCFNSVFLLGIGPICIKLIKNSLSKVNCARYQRTKFAIEIQHSRVRILVTRLRTTGWTPDLEAARCVALRAAASSLAGGFNRGGNEAEQSDEKARRLVMRTMRYVNTQHVIGHVVATSPTEDYARFRTYKMQEKRIFRGSSRKGFSRIPSRSPRFLRFLSANLTEMNIQLPPAMIHSWCTMLKCHTRWSLGNNQTSQTVSNSEGRRLEAEETEWLGQGEPDAKLCHAHRLDNSSERLFSTSLSLFFFFSLSISSLLNCSLVLVRSSSFLALFSLSSLFIYSLPSSSIFLVLAVLPRLRTFPTSPSSCHLLYLVSYSISLLSFLDVPYLRFLALFLSSSSRSVFHFFRIANAKHDLT